MIVRRIKTELGTEKFCKGCNEYYPETNEFFFGTSKYRKNGTQLLETLCKACYNVKYGRSLIRSNNVAYRYL